MDQEAKNFRKYKMKRKEGKEEHKVRKKVEVENGREW